MHMHSIHAIRANPMSNLVHCHLLLLALLVTGCTSIDVRANKDPASVRKINRMFVLIQHGDVDDQPYSRDLADALRNAFANTPVNVDIAIANPVELDEKIHMRRISQLQPDAAMVIKATGEVLSEYGGYPTIIYDVSLFEPDLEKRLWRARVDNSGGTALMKRRMREMAERIIKQLRTDGFL